MTFDLRALQAETVLSQRNAMGTGVAMQNAMNAQLMAQQEAAIQQ